MSETRFSGKWKAFAEPKKARMLDPNQPDLQYLYFYALAWRICYLQETQSPGAPKIEGIQYLDHFGQIISPVEIHWEEQR